MLFDGSYVRIGSDLLPANIGSNTAPIVGGGVFDLDASLDASGVDINAFGWAAKEALSGRKAVAKQMLPRSKMAKEVLLIAIRRIDMEIGPTVAPRNDSPQGLSKIIKNVGNMPQIKS